VTQRGNRRARTFFEDCDYELYGVFNYAITVTITNYQLRNYGDSLLNTLIIPYYHHGSLTSYCNSRLPHHVTQRGNRRDRTFFEDGGYKLYGVLLGEAARKAETEIWCYCLMPNHVHIIIVPSDEDGLRLVVNLRRRNAAPKKVKD
jgi:hypothetical protein